MRAIPLCASLLLLCSAARLCGQVESQELLTLRSNKQKEELALRALYRSKLETLLKTETAKGNLEGAAAIREELTKLDPSLGASLSPSSVGPTAALAKKLLESPIRWSSGNTLVEFKPDGVWTEYEKGATSHEGRWTRELDSELIRVAATSGGYKFMYRLGEDGSAIFGPGGRRFQLQTGEIATSPAPAVPPPTAPTVRPGDGSSNPFGSVK